MWRTGEGMPNGVVTYVAVVKIPPPPKPPSWKKYKYEEETIVKDSGKVLTNLAAMRVSMLVENPQAKVPRPAKNTAAWFAPRRPITLDSRP